YFVSMHADKIVAQPATITGSIGVFSGKFVLKGLYDKLGITKELLLRGAHADIFSEYRPWDEEETARMDELMLSFYRDFVTRAAQGRGKSYDQIDAVAQGRVWTGTEALAVGLVDRLGGLEDAVALAKDRAKIARDQDVDLIVLPERKGLLETILERQEDSLETALPSDVRALLHWAHTASRGGLSARLPYHLRVR
ncbi:MAG: S49 family peptidase, partial [Anaerolineales bacterium]